MSGMPRLPPGVLVVFAAGASAALSVVSPTAVYAQEPYWSQYHITLTRLSEAQKLELENTVNRIQSLRAETLAIDKDTYTRLSRFKKLYRFALDPDDLLHWLLSRIREISFRTDGRFAAFNQNQGQLILSPVFFNDLSVLERLYLLIHEARHSDDDGHRHVPCPRNFRYLSAGQPEVDLAGESACDNEETGAYAFQAAFLFELFAYGLFDQREVGLLYNSSIIRVLPSQR